MDLLKKIREILRPRKEHPFRGCAIFPLGLAFEKARQELQLNQDELA
jgi:hypothetical protein